MKYRIVTTSNDSYPYSVERSRSWFFKFWWPVEKFSSKHSAEHFIKKSLFRRVKEPVGTVVYEFDETDLLVDKLQKSSQYTEVSSGDIGMSADR